MTTIDELMARTDAMHNALGFTSPQQEADIMELRQAAERRAAPSPFKVGDIVMPRKDAPLIGSARLLIVVAMGQDYRVTSEVKDTDQWPASEVFDLILLYRDKDCIYSQRACSWMYEPWSEA